MSHFIAIAPRLPVADLQRSIAFYQDTLGFHMEVAWPDPNPTFALLTRDNVTIGLFEPMQDQSQSIGYAELYIEVDSAQELHAAWKERVKVEWGPEVYSYGRREFAVRDPDSYLVIFTEPTEDPVSADEP